MEEKELSQEQPFNKNLLREKLYIAQQAVEGQLKVLPADKWAFHYHKGENERNERLTNLLQGRETPETVADDLKPDALIYNVEDIKKDGLSAVCGRIKDISAYIAYYDYPGFARFVSDFKGLDVTPEFIQTLYDGIAKSRVQKKMLDSYGITGRQQIEMALKKESERIIERFGSLSHVEKILDALKLNWLSEDLNCIKTEQRDLFISMLSAEERELFEKLKIPYKQFVQKGEEKAYKLLTDEIRKNIPKIQHSEEQKNEEQLQKEIEPYINEENFPGTPYDQAIPPEDQDEYHTPESISSKETEKSQPFFEITPSGISKTPLTGYYCSGRKSYYDKQTKTWSKKKQLLPYSGNFSGDETQTISGRVNSGIKSVPIPNGYALNISSLQYKESKPEFFHDQNSCFYIKTDGMNSFSIDFLKESSPFVNPPISEDLAPLYNGFLSSQTEEIIKKVYGDSIEKAKQISQYILANHCYPGGGDLISAQALQLKLRTESTGDNYLQNIDKSDYLECYSANTLFIALMRKIGVPARLVVGHKIQGAKGGKAVIDKTTGHAWSEIWDGRSWRRIDATPQPKPEDKKQREEDKFDNAGQQADDEGIEQSQPGNQKTEDFTDQKMAEANDSEIRKAETDLQQAKETMEQMTQTKTDMDKKISDTESFKKLEEILDQIEKTDLLDNMKQDLEKKIEAKEKLLKEEIKEKLDNMVDSGFLDQEKREELEKKLEEINLDELDNLEQQINEENQLYQEYEQIKEEIEPCVEKWFEYFFERLPKKEDIEKDEDSLNRQGAFNKRSVMRPRNLLFGRVKNRQIIKSSVEPRFLAAIVLDVSGSMSGEKLKQARKLLVFYNGLFSRISEEFGYIRYANYIFSDSLSEIKRFDHDYNSNQKYMFDDGAESTIKVRLMKAVSAKGGTNMLDAITTVAKDLNEESFQYRDHASAFYFLGDGEDTYGNSQKIKEFLKLKDNEEGFGKHLLSAILLGDESVRMKLADIFGDENTTVASDFDELLEQSMERFDIDIEEYLRNKVV